MKSLDFIFPVAVFSATNVQLSKYLKNRENRSNSEGTTLFDEYNITLFLIKGASHHVSSYPCFY